MIFFLWKYNFLFSILMLIYGPGGNNASKKKLTQLEAAKTLKGFIAEGYLTKRGTRAQKVGFQRFHSLKVGTEVGGI